MNGDALSLWLAAGGLLGSALRVLLTSSQPVLSKKSGTDLVVGVLVGFLWPLYPLIDFPDRATTLQKAAIVAAVAYLAGDMLINLMGRITAALGKLNAPMIDAKKAVMWLALVPLLAGCGGPVTGLLQRDVNAALRTLEQAKLAPTDPAVQCLGAVKAELDAVDAVRPEIAGLVSLGAAGYVARQRSEDAKTAITAACDALLGRLVREGAKAGLRIAPLPF